MSETAKLIQEIGVAFEEFKSGYNARLDDLEKIAARPALKETSGEILTGGQKEHVDAFSRWLKNPHSPETKAHLAQFDTKAASGLSEGAGGFLVPEFLFRQIESRVQDVNPFRGLVRVIGASSGDIRLPVNNNDAGVGWVGEGDTRTATAEPTGAQRTPTTGTIYGYVSSSEELIYDSAFDVRSWFVEAVGDALANAEAEAIVTGNGTKKPTGFLNATPEAVGDNDSPARTVGALEYIATGTLGAFVANNAGSPYTCPEDVFADVAYRVRSQYRANGTWVMSSSTAAAVRKLRDSDNRSFWVDSMAMGTPPMLLGRPVVIAEQMPAIGANSYSIAFGDWRRAYTLVELGGLRITVDDNITTPGQVKFYIRRRLGGITVNDDAVKLMKFAAS
ncbi:phage major capsid protein [Limibaculum sp. M0105]|uniref:Phage major capsid protein n=1 Tax=Thermohalobaculum xanthum TaxID=2753746 RepID=A0A8J7M860_9RHOB|nr:phage major capsid protein [Thermohalobaculum xanthum]MBK0399510.1 phage major capsid protein [Thermohalobaculum xanthum]